MNETQGKSIVQHLSLPALPYDIYASSSPLPPSSHPLSHSLKLRDGISPPLTTHIPLALCPTLAFHHLSTPPLTPHASHLHQ